MGLKRRLRKMDSVLFYTAIKVGTYCGQSGDGKRARSTRHVAGSAGAVAPQPSRLRPTPDWIPPGFDNFASLQSFWDITA